MINQKRAERDQAIGLGSRKKFVERPQNSQKKVYTKLKPTELVLTKDEHAFLALLNGQERHKKLVEDTKKLYMRETFEKDKIIAGEAADKQMVMVVDELLKR